MSQLVIIVQKFWKFWSVLILVHIIKLITYVNAMFLKFLLVSAAGESYLYVKSFYTLQRYQIEGTNKGVFEI